MKHDIKVEVRGIRELGKALKQVDSELPKSLRAGFKRIATRVADTARAKVPRRTGRAASSITPRASTRGAGIAFGGSKAEYYPWLDFGGKVGRNDSVTRPFITEGRYIYPTIKEMNDEIKQEVDKILEEVIKDAGLTTKGGE